MDIIEEAVKVLNQGGIVIYPTDTAFGIGCRIDNEVAIERLFKIRRRPKSQAVPVLVENRKMAQKYLLPVLEPVRKLMESYWPGGLTIVYPCLKEMVPPLVRGNGANLGVRVPDHSQTLKLIHKLGVPILGPSANFHGQPTPFRIQDLDPRLIKLAEMVVEGVCNLKRVSTVIDCSLLPWKILRQGSVNVRSSLKNPNFKVKQLHKSL